MVISRLEESAVKARRRTHLRYNGTKDVLLIIHYDVNSNTEW
jgi:hypothetical protein